MRTKDDIFKLAYCRQRMKGTVTGEGDLDRIRRGYQWRRRNQHPVTIALGLALVGKSMPSHSEADIGAPDSNGYRHLTKPNAFGLRWAGYSDEIADGSTSHAGWYITTDGRSEEVYRGCVFRLPGRMGEARYLACLLYTSDAADD